jgi:hypothetical protein
MTEQKHLKKLVRERMSATGESYSTARRHVLAKAARAEAAPLPAGVLPNYDTFGAGYHRESALVAHLLRQAGVTAPHTGEPYTEAMIGGLAGGIGFMYAVFEYKELPPIMTIVAQHHPAPWAPEALSHLRIPYVEEHAGKPAAGLTKLRAALDRGHAALCTVDRSRLPWHGMEPGFGTDPYVVVVAGSDGDTLFIDDESASPHPMSTTDFAAAWSAHKKGRHHLLTLAGSAAAEADPADVGLANGAGAVDLAGAIRAAIATTVAHLTGPVLGNHFDVNFGFSGMTKLADQLRDGRNKTGWAARFGAPVPFFHGVRRLYDCLELEYTGPGATRPLYAAFLDEAAPVVGSAALAEAAALFRESAAGWSTLATRALETSSSLGEYAELAQERWALMFARGEAARPEIGELNARIEELISAHAEDDPLGDDGRRKLFDALADQVDACRALEQSAVALLTGALEGRRH